MIIEVYLFVYGEQETFLLISFEDFDDGILCNYVQFSQIYSVSFAHMTGILAG